jgi:hypothetical protein
MEPNALPAELLEETRSGVPQKIIDNPVEAVIVKTLESTARDPPPSPRRCWMATVVMGFIAHIVDLPEQLARRWTILSVVRRLVVAACELSQQQAARWGTLCITA